MDLRIVITTYNRPEMCLNLVNSLCDYDVTVYNDGGDDVNTDLYDVHQVYFPHSGKRFYWWMWNRIFQDLKDSDYVLFLPDDVTLHPDGESISRLVNLFRAIDDPNKVCLNPLVDKRGHVCQWNTFDPVRTVDVWQTQWFDCCGLVNRAFFETLSYNVAPVPQEHFLNNQSSGVGSQISKRLHAAGRTMYQVHESLLQHGEHASVMHPEFRQENPL